MAEEIIIELLQKLVFVVLFSFFTSVGIAKLKKINNKIKNDYYGVVRLSKFVSWAAFAGVIAFLVTVQLSITSDEKNVWIFGSIGLVSAVFIMYTKAKFYLTYDHSSFEYGNFKSSKRTIYYNDIIDVVVVGNTDINLKINDGTTIPLTFIHAGIHGFLKEITKSVSSPIIKQKISKFTGI